MTRGASRNALLRRHESAVAAQTPRPALSHASVLAKTIGHAALLSDTPAKWASTIEMLRRNGIDPHGYEPFESGRPAAIAAAGYRAPSSRVDHQSEKEP